VAESGHRAHQRLLVGEVVDLAATVLGVGHGAGDDEHRDRVVIGLRNRRDRVGQARPADQDAHARFAGHARPAVGHEGGTLLMPRGHVAQRRGAESAVQLEGVHAGDPEDRARPHPLDQRDERLTA